MNRSQKALNKGSKAFQRALRGGYANDTYKKGTDRHKYQVRKEEWLKSEGHSPDRQMALVLWLESEMRQVHLQAFKGTYNGSKGSEAFLQGS